ncbi:MAG: crossover junction endodeoxyribonuclease RuvC [Deltaproteobacteria bacterium]|nr:crossover junction endodeoxyribonuclease RuvC [Deltaproteobacteria bacterium]
MIIFGIDPGIHTTGYGVIEKGKDGLRDVLHGEIRNANHIHLSAGLVRIYDHLAGIIRQVSPDVIAIEDIFYGKNIKSLIKQGQVRGVAILAGSRHDIPVVEYTPLEVKKAVVGYGRAEKSQVQHMVKAILGLPALPPADASDALAIAICHANTGKDKTL